MSDYVCSRCGAAAYHDGRCGDGPVLTCNCVSRGRWIDDGRGGYMVYPGNPRPVVAEDVPNEDDNYWERVEPTR